MRKRYIKLSSLLMIFIFLLCGCQAAALPDTETPSPISTPVRARSAAAAEAHAPNETETDELPSEQETGTAEEAKTEEPGEQEALPFVNPLTGEGTETDISANRPYVIMLNTIKQAMPQSGNSRADLYYECLEEGGITRIMGVFQDITGVGKIGAIRSTRPYYVRLVYALDGLMVHAGGSDEGLAEIDVLGVSSINALRAASSIFYRDQARLSAGFAKEHTMYVNSDDLQSWAGNRDGMATEHSSDYYGTHHHEFSENGTPDGESATTITVPYSSYKTDVFTYNAEENVYEVSMYDAPYIDEQTGETITVTNVLVLKTYTETLSTGRMRIDLLGTGEGYYISGGKYIPITWSKADYGDLFTLTDSSGREIVFNIGKTYINIIPTDKTVTFE